MVIVTSIPSCIHIWQALIFDHGRIATYYQEEANKWGDIEYYDQHVKRIQLPYNIPISTPLTPDQQREKRKELAKKLVEINARKRVEKVSRSLN